MKLRPYQQEAFDCTLAAFERVNSALIVMATGLGKTVVFTHLAAHFRNSGRIMVLAHREELIFQAKDKIATVCGGTCDVEMGESWASRGFYKSDIVVSTVQTQIAGRNGGRMTHFDPMEFSLLVIDECFVAGTLIDGVPIEQITVGQKVNCFDHNKKQITKKEVKRVFKNPATKLVIVKLNNGQKITCTPNHPIFTLTGYKPAAILTSSDVVISTTHKQGVINESAGLCYLRNGLHAQKLELKSDPLLHKGVCVEGNFSKTQNSCSSMQNLQEENYIAGQKWTCASQQEEHCMFARMPEEAKFDDNGENKSQICFPENAGKQSHETARDKSQSFNKTQSEGLEAAKTRRQWKLHCAATNDCLCAGLADGSCNPNTVLERGQSPESVQSGRRQCRFKNCHRSRRQQSQNIESQICRCQEGCSLEAVGVESVEIIERLDSVRFGLLCPDGYVYNLEVEEHHNYFANGILVHNCHHAPAASYKKIIEHYRQNPNLKILGVTATPDRTDEKAMGQVFQEVAYAYDIGDGINDGWLVPIEQQSVFVKGLDYSSVKTTAGDLNGKDLAEVLEFEENLHAIAHPTVELTGDKKTLIFAASVAQAERLSEIINRHKPQSANFVCGSTPKEIRRQMFSDYAAGKFQYLCNVGVLTEGFDDPSIEIVVMARPTKSRALYAQMAGRGTRPLPGLVDGLTDEAARREAILQSAKPSVEIIDFVGNAGRHKLVTTADILGGRYEDDVIELAKKNAAEKSEKSKKPVDIATELQQAEREIAHRRKMAEEALNRDKILLRANYSKAKVNPFNVLDIDPWRERAWHKGKPVTDGQKKYLEKCGVNTDGLSFTHASQLIDNLISRRKESKCTYKQAQLLQRFNYDTNVTFEQASAIIDKLARNKWKRVG